MIKQPYQILKWYNGHGEQDYYDLTKHKFEIQRYHTGLLPSFVIKRDERGELITEFDIINFEDATTYDLTNTNLNPGYTDNFQIRPDNNGYDYLVWEYFPTKQDIPPGLYYFKVSDGIETWYSEIFELCDYWSHLVTNSTNDTPAWTQHVPNDFANYFYLTLNEVGGGATNYTNNFSVIYNESIQVYIFEDLTSKTDNLEVWLEESSTGTQISDRYEIVEGTNTITLSPQKTCTARLRFELANGEYYGAELYMWIFYYYIPNDRTVLRWSDDQNFCSIPFEDGFAGYVVLEGYPHEDSTSIEEDSDEDDEKNIYPLIQTVQKWYTHTIGSGVHFMEGLSMLRLFDTVTFTQDDGYTITAMDISLDSSSQDDFLYILSLSYREDSCSKEACGFDTECCCPDLEAVLDYEPALGALPACGAGTDGDRYLVRVGGFDYIYECDNGVGWVRQTDEEVNGNCVEDNDANALETYSPNYWYWQSGTTFNEVVQFDSVTDNADGTATLNGAAVDDNDTFNCKVWVQAQYDTGGGFVDIGDPVSSDEFDNNGITVDTGAGNFDFRVRYYIHNCIDQYDGDINQTIT